MVTILVHTDPRLHGDNPGTLILVSMVTILVHTDRVSMVTILVHADLALFPGSYVGRVHGDYPSNGVCI